MIRGGIPDREIVAYFVLISFSRFHAQPSQVVVGHVCRLTPDDYLLVGVTDAEGAFRKACELAVNHQPPFEKSSDKGFKDFVIGWTVKELLAKAPNDQVVVLTKDNRLKDYLEESLGVKVVKLKEDFIELAQSSQARTISKDDYAGLNEAARLRSGERNERDEVSILINSLKLSDNFNTTRGLIPALAQRRNEMSSDDKVALLRIAVKNTQVRWLLHDDDIASFFVPLLAECGDSLSVREVDELVASFKDDHLIEVCACMDVDATDEYTSFVRKFDISLISVEAGARIESLSFRILPRLKAVIADNKMERRIPFGSDVYESFIEPGKFECMSWGFDFDVLESFVNMMESVGWQQRFLMCRSIASRIREVADRST